MECGGCAFPTRKLLLHGKLPLISDWSGSSDADSVVVIDGQQREVERGALQGNTIA